MSVYSSGMHNAFGTTLDLSTVGTTAGTFSTGMITILSLTPPAETKNFVDVTNWGTTDYFKQKLPSGIIRTAPVQITGILLTCSSMTAFPMLSTNVMSLRRLWDETAKCGFKITFPGSTDVGHIICFDGYITDFGITTPFDDKITFEMSIKPTGKPWITNTTVGL